MGWFGTEGRALAEKKQAQVKSSQLKTNAHNLKESLKDHFKIGKNKKAFGATGIYQNGIGEGSIRESAGTYVYRNEKWVRQDSLHEDTGNTVNILIKIH